MKLFKTNKDNSNNYDNDKLNNTKYNNGKFNSLDKPGGHTNYNHNSHNSSHIDIGSTKVISLKIFLTWGAVFLWMALIFYLSHQPATESSELSQGVLAIVMSLVQRISPNLARKLELLQITYMLRKNAHFFAYLVLAMLTMIALVQNRVYGKRQLLYTFLICLLYAITDEVHQLFIPGRSGEVKDVLLNSFGALTGILLYRIPAFFRHLK